MILSDYFAKENIVRQGSFDQTMYPGTDMPNSICYAANLAFLRIAQENPNVTCLITSPPLAEHIEAHLGIVAVENPRLEYYHLHNHLVHGGHLRLALDHHIDPDADIHPTAVIGHPVRIERGACIGPYSVIADYTIIGEDTFSRVSPVNLFSPRTLSGRIASIFGR